MKAMTKLYLLESEMPENCLECPLLDNMSDTPNLFCQATFQLVNDSDVDIESERHSSCPLEVLK